MQPLHSFQLPRTISHVFFGGCSEQVRAGLLARMPIQEGDMLSDDLLERARAAVKQFDEHLELRVDGAHSPEVYLSIPQEVKDRYKFRAPASDDGVNVTIYDPATLPQRIKLEGSQYDSMLLKEVPPIYPLQDGKVPRESGVVQLGVVVGKDGIVIDVHPQGGSESLIGAAMEAVRQWKYRPMLVNGFPVEVKTTVHVSFPAGR